MDGESFDFNCVNYNFIAVHYFAGKRHKINAERITWYNRTTQ